MVEQKVGGHLRKFSRVDASGELTPVEPDAQVTASPESKGRFYEDLRGVTGGSKHPFVKDTSFAAGTDAGRSTGMYAVYHPHDGQEEVPVDWDGEPIARYDDGQPFVAPWLATLSAWDHRDSGAPAEALYQVLEVADGLHVQKRETGTELSCEVGNDEVVAASGLLEECRDSIKRVL